MKQFSRNLFIACASLILLNNKVFAQKFSATSPTTLKPYTTAAVSPCPGTVSPIPTSGYAIPVNSVGTLTSTNTLADISLSFNTTYGCGGVSDYANEFYGLKLIVIAPDGKCAIVLYNPAGTATKAGVQIDLSLRDGTTACAMDVAKSTDIRLDNTNYNTIGQTTTTSGMYGAVSAHNGSTEVALTNAFLNANSTGTWRIIPYGDYGTEPCLIGASLTFGNPTTTNYMGSSTGESCTNPIVFDGKPICATSSGRSPSLNSPGAVGAGASGCASGTGNCAYTLTGWPSCWWNSSNDNDTWVKFTAKATGPTCLAISGIASGFNLQSIIVEDVSGTNCTASNGLGWTVKSCPRTAPQIYTGSGGTNRNQQHCFNAEAGKSYYLVVDGNAGDVSDFYITGMSGPGLTLLPVKLKDFSGEYQPESNSSYLYWSTESEQNNDYFTLEKSYNGYEFMELAVIKGAGNASHKNEYAFTDVQPYEGVTYYRLSQTDYNGHQEYFSVIPVRSQVQDFAKVQVATDGIAITFGNTVPERVNIQVLNLNGQVIYSGVTWVNKDQSGYTIPKLQQANGLYLVNIQGERHRYCQKVLLMNE